MLNWLNRQKSSPTATAAAYPQPSLANWRNREKAGTSRNARPAPERLIRRSRRLKALEVFAIAVVISMIVGVDLYIFGINKRLSALESEFVEVKGWAFPASLLEGKYASLNARVRALTAAYSSLDAKLTSVATQQEPVNVEARAAEDGSMMITEAGIPTEAPAAGTTVQPPAEFTPASVKTGGMISRSDEEAPIAAPETTDSRLGIAPVESASNATLALQSTEKEPVDASAEKPALPAATPATTTETNSPQTVIKGGRWVINLLSDPNEALAERFATKARDQGVAVEQNRTEVKGRIFWRVQITGFGTASEARARANEIKTKLNLNDVWIFKQKG